MDDVYHQHNPYRDASSGHDHNHRQQQQSPRYKRPLTYNGGGVHGKTSNPLVSSYLTTQNFGILIAILVIYLFQRKDGFGRVLAAQRDGGFWRNACMDWWCEFHDYVTAYSQMMVECLRNLRVHMLAHGDDWFYDFTSLPPHSAHHTGAMPSTARGRRRNMVASVTRGLGVGIGEGNMPELEETDSYKKQRQQNEALMIVDGELEWTWDKENIAPMEPAFLKDEDYPPGWLVFDPVLGVVSKTEADRYTLEQKRKKAERLHKQQQSEQQKFQQQQDEDDTEPPQLPHKQQEQPAIHTKSPVRQLPQPSVEQKKQPSTPQHSQKNSGNSKNNASSRPLRNNNVMPNTSAMHTPHTIAANG